MKAGIKTTEFWISAILALVGPVVTIFVGTGMFAEEDAQVVTETITTNAEAIVQAVTLIVANIVSILSVRQYVQSRTEVKTKETSS